MKDKLTKGDEKRLADFLARHRHDGALSLLETKGFLFMVACCPEPTSVTRGSYERHPAA